MKKKKIITICSSVSFYKEALSVSEELEKLGFKVLVPTTALRMRESGDYDADEHKVWFRKPKEYTKKKEFMIEHFDFVIKGDAILVLNLKKKDIKGYIGGNVLMEMAIAFHYKKPIFIYDAISEELIFKEEIYGMLPIFIQKDLAKITLTLFPSP